MSSTRTKRVAINGLSLTKIRFASLPTATVPNSLSFPRNLAASAVPALRASYGVKPAEMKFESF